MNDPITQLLKDRDVLLADGAMGTNLFALGLANGAPGELWNVHQPDNVRSIHQAFVDAGSDIILTCTFGATRTRLKGAAHGADVVQINKAAADLARRAASTREGVLVGGSIGPLGQLLKPYGPLTLEEAGAAYAEQARALYEGGVDLLVIETQYALGEVDAALSAVKAVTDLPVVISFSYDRGTRTMMGVRPSDVAGRYTPDAVAMIGANCGTILQNMEKILGEYTAAVPGSRLWAKPNAGLPRVDDGQTVYDVSPAQMAEFAQRAVHFGARVVGGCCGSTPEHIAAMAEAVRSKESHP